MGEIFPRRSDPEEAGWVEMPKTLLAIIVALALPTGAPAQDVSDWDLTEDAARKLVVASTSFSNGLTIGLRCMDGRYDALISGLPAAAHRAENRSLSLQFGDDDPDERLWFVGTTPTVAISDLPARLARKLRDGGQLQLRVQEANEGRRLRYVLDLPTSNVHVDRTLSACGRPTVDPRDAQIADLGQEGLPVGVNWRRAPEPSYPDGRTFTRGFATISCLNQADGQLRDCVVESEFPLGGGFGEETLKATRRARIGNVADRNALLSTGMIIFRTTFRMREAGEGSARERSGTRLPRDR